MKPIYKATLLPKDIESGDEGKVLLYESDLEKECGASPFYKKYKGKFQIEEIKYELKTESNTQQIMDLIEGLNENQINALKELLEAGGK